MFKINLKREYQITVTTELNIQVLYDRTLSRLEDEEYRIVEKNHIRIVFDDNANGLFRLRGSSSNLNEGFFDFVQSENVTVLKLSYFVNYQVAALIFIFTILYSIFNSSGGLFLSIFMVITILLDMAIQKSRGKNLIESIVTTVA